MSDSSESDNNFSVLDLLVKKGHTTLPAIRRRNLRNRLLQKPVDINEIAKDIDDDFKLNISNVFNTDAKRNSKVAENDKLIKKYITEHENKVREIYEKIKKAKQILLDEINDNGTDFIRYSASNEEDLKLLEYLFLNSQKGYDHVALNRHFYFYSNVRRPHHNLDCSLPFKVNEFLVNENESLQNMVKIYLKQFINYSLVNIANTTILYQVIEFCQTIPSSETHMKIDEFLNYITITGGNSNLTTIQFLPMKIKQFNSHVKIILLRLMILFYFVLSHRFSDDLYLLVVKVFILTLSDHNLNKKGYNDLILFTSNIFKELIHWRVNNLDGTISLKHDIIVVEWNRIINQTLVTVAYGQQDVSGNKRVDYELQYNILRLLLLSVRTGNFALKITTSLICSYLNDTCFLLNKQDNLLYELMPSDSFTKSILENLLSTNEILCLKSDSFSSRLGLNKIYLNYYKLLLLNAILPNTFHDNTAKQKTDDHGISKKSNITKLKIFDSLIAKLKQSIYHKLHAIGSANLDNNSLFNKEELVKYITDSYHLVDFLSKTLKKNINVLNEDTFYDDIHI